MSMETITLDEAMELFKLPRQVGEYEGLPVTIGAGRFGPYVLHDKKYTSLPKDADPMSITLEECIQLIEGHRKEEADKHLRVFVEDDKLEVINGRYGEPTGLDDFLHKADLVNYDGTRAMFESFRANVPRATGIVQWMLNSARPGLYWQLYDYYLVPNASYYSVKKGNAPVQLVLDYAKRTVYAVNEQMDMSQLQASMSLYGLDGKLLAERTYPVSVAPYSSVKAFDVPVVEGVSFLFLALKDCKGNAIANNEYALSSVADEYDWSTSDWYKTEFTRFADYKPLSQLPKADVQIKSREYKDGRLTLTLSNASDCVAFFIRLSAKNAAGELIVPAFWSDNYVSIPPRAELQVACALPEPPQSLTLSGWNLR
jgi:exo-1,4-beta-D-glucosaminidase